MPRPGRRRRRRIPWWIPEGTGSADGPTRAGFLAAVVGRRGASSPPWMSLPADRGTPIAGSSRMGTEGRGDAPPRAEAPERSAPIPVDDDAEDRPTDGREIARDLAGRSAGRR